MMTRPRLATIPLLAILMALAVSPTPAQTRNVGGPADYYMREKIAAVFSRDPELTAAQLTLILVNGGVVLSGPVPSCNLRLRALSTAGATLGVINVTDQMYVIPNDLSDETLRAELLDILKPQMALLEIENLEVRVEEKIATLTGTVKDFYSRIKAEEAAGTVAGVTEIVNRLQPANAPGGTDDDSIADALVKYLGASTEYPYPSEITIDVKDGRATLRGLVRLHLGRRQARSMAGLVGGVKEVESLLRVDPTLPIRRGTVKRGA